MGKNDELDELWEETQGSQECSKCRSLRVHGHIREINVDLAVVDWVCDDCGYKWSDCSLFKGGCLVVDADSEVFWFGVMNYCRR